MSFYTKYQELGLGDYDLISWLQFNSNITDSGPNGSVWTTVGAGANLTVPGEAKFTTGEIKLASGDVDNFTLFIDFEKLAAANNSSIFSCTPDGGHFAFVSGPSGTFYVIIRDAANVITYSGAFKKTDPPARCIVALSKFDNTFLLYLYDPYADEIEAELLTVPYDKYFVGSEYRVAERTFALTDDSNFILKELAVVRGGMPGFCILELCKAIYNNQVSNSFKYAWVSVADKGHAAKFTTHTGTNKLNTGVLLPYSISPTGYSLLNNVANPTYARVFKDGVLTASTFEDGYVTFSGMTPEQEVLCDFFTATQGTGVLTNFTGSAACVAAKGGLPVYVDNLRLHSGYKLVSGTSLAAGFDLIFPSEENLIEI